MEHFLSDNSKLKRWMLLEKEVLFSLGNLIGIERREIAEWLNNIPDIKSHEVSAEELKTKHDFVAFLRVLEEKTKHLSASKWVHYGLTSSDIIDTASSLLLREVNQLIIKHVEELQKTLYILAEKYRNTLQVGRTHGKHAEPTSFGYKFAITYQELEGALELLYLSRRQVEVVTIKGSTGTYAHISPEIQEDLAYRLRLFTINGSTQAFPRNRYSTYLYSLSLIGQIINSLALNLRTLTREEIAEVAGHFEEDQIGSSSMPHKSNPVTLENISGLARWLTKIGELSQDNSLLWDERDISHSSVERMSLIDAPILAFNIITKMNTVLQGLKVNEEQLEKNLSLTKGLINSQSILLDLLKSTAIKSRSEAHSIISQLSETVVSGTSPSFAEAVNASPVKKLLKDKESVSGNLQKHLNYLPQLYSQIFRKEIEKKYYVKEIFNKHEINNAIYYMAQRINWYYSKFFELSEPKGGDVDSVLVISLLEGASTLTGTILPLLHFPVKCVSLHYSISTFTEKMKKNKTYFLKQSSNDNLTEALSEDKMKQMEILKFVEHELNKSAEFQKIMEMAKNCSRILILEDIVDSKVTLKTLYRILATIPTVKEIKCASLFIKVVDPNVDSFHTEDYYAPSFFPPTLVGYITEKEMREFNFKNWNDQNHMKLFNWYGLIIQDNVWVIGYGLDSSQKYRNFQSLGEVDKRYI